MANTTSPPLNFPIDEVHYRVEHIKDHMGMIIACAKEIQKKLLINSTLSDPEEKHLLDQVDKSMEDFLVQIISKKFTNDFFLCECVGEIYGKNDYRWVIDSIDGSMNFLRGIPLYSICIGLQYRNHTIAGIVIVPDLQDFYHSILGHGAFKNNQPIHVSKIKSLDRSLLISSFPSNRTHVMREIISEISAFVNSGRSIRRTGSIVIDLCWLAEGRIDGLWEKIVKIFDLAGTSLILTEAGGRITDFNSEPIASYPADIVASNGSIHPQIIEILKKSRYELGLN